MRQDLLPKRLQYIIYAYFVIPYDCNSIHQTRMEHIHPSGHPYYVQCCRNGKDFSRPVLFGPQKYQGIGVKNPFFLQEIIRITAFLNEAACNSSIGELLKAYAEFFRVELGIPLVQVSMEVHVRSSLQTGYHQRL